MKERIVFEVRTVTKVLKDVLTNKDIEGKEETIKAIAKQLKSNTSYAWSFDDEVHANHKTNTKKAVESYFKGV